MKRILLSFPAIILFAFSFKLFAGDPPVYESPVDDKVGYRVTGALPSMQTKALICQSMILELAERIGYKGHILLDFEGSQVIPGDVFFLSYDSHSGTTRKEREKSEQKHLEGDYSYRPKNSSQNKTVIVQNAGNPEFEPMLKLAEYAMLNLKEVRRTQRDTTASKETGRVSDHAGGDNPESGTVRFKTIPRSKLDEIVSAPASALVREIMNLRTEPETPGPEQKYSLYWQDGKYYIYTTTAENSRVVLNDIYMFRVFAEPEAAIVFDTDSTFISICEESGVRRFQIPFMVGGLRPDAVKAEDPDRLSIEYTVRYPGQDRGKTVRAYYTPSTTTLTLPEKE